MRKLMLSICGGLLAATAALAQAPVAMPKPVVAPPAAVAPVPAPVAAPAVVAAPVAAPAIGGGCSTCGTAAAHQHNHRLLIGVGTANPVGCGCHAAEKTFVFGSCKQFFNPGRTCDGINLHGGRDRCPLPGYAAPYGKPANNCNGIVSYLDR